MNFISTAALVRVFHQLLLTGTISIGKVFSWVKPFHGWALSATIAPALYAEAHIHTILLHFLCLQLFTLITTVGAGIAWFHGLPTMIATIFAQRMQHGMKTTEKAIWATALGAAIAIFSTHPAVESGWIFSLYWLFPLFYVLITPRYPFFTMLSATFVAHAVGTIGYVLTFASTPLLWQSLIALAAYERLSHAVLLTGVYYAMHIYRQRRAIYNAVYSYSARNL